MPPNCREPERPGRLSQPSTSSQSCARSVLAGPEVAPKPRAFVQVQAHDCRRPKTRSSRARSTPSGPDCRSILGKPASTSSLVSARAWSMESAYVTTVHGPGSPYRAIDRLFSSF